MKSNPIKPLTKEISKTEGMGFDCASQGEIKTALKLGTKPENIVYSNPIKVEGDIHYAKSQNVLLTTADTFDELLKIQKVAPEMKILWRLSITEDNAQTLATTFSNKFGDDLNSISEIEEKFK